MYRYFNPNPTKKNVGDCTIRALSAALNRSWDDVYWELAEKGFKLCDMPSANNVWGSYLHDKGFKRKILEDTCPDCYTVKDFCDDHPYGIYVLALSRHVICAIDGDYYDSWDSGNEIPLYYWGKR